MKSLARAEDISQVNKLYRQIPSCIPVQGEARKELILVRVMGQEDWWVLSETSSGFSCCQDKIWSQC